MVDTNVQMQLKNLTSEEFQGMGRPDGYAFAHFDFHAPSEHVLKFRLLYGNRKDSPFLGLNGINDEQSFDQAYLSIGQGLAKKDYASEKSSSPLLTPSGVLTKPFELKEALTKHDLSVIVNDILLKDFSDVSVPYVMLYGVKLKDANRYNIPTKKIHRIFQPK